MRKFFITKTLLPFLFIICFKLAAIAQEGTTYLMSNSSININCDSWLVDPDSLRGNYPQGVMTMVLSTSSGSQIGVQLDSFRMRNDGDVINVYDGPTTASPLLTSLTNNCSPLCTSFDFGVKSTGSTITVVFGAGGPVTSFPGLGFRLRLRCIKDVTPTTDFLPIYQQLFGGGNIRLDDYDKDGDLDALVGGAIYRNDTHDDSQYVFDRIVKPLGNWRNCSFVAADFDNDGWKDVFITGETDASGLFTRRSMIFRNVNGVFTANTTTTFFPMAFGMASVVDYNNDGKMDIAYSGYTGTSYVFKVYLNNGNFNFTEQTTNLPGFIDGSMSWLDYDNDGDMDLVYNGRVGNTQPQTGLFINNNNSFTNAGLVMYNTYGGDIRWVDINMDGKYDIVNSGWSDPSGAIGVEILFNNGGGNFTRVITNLPKRFSGHFDWADYDNDGDMDVLLTGTEFTNGIISGDAGLYKNNGNGNFTKKSLVVNSNATPRWVDFNKDGKLDIVLPARQNEPSLFYKNMGADSFRVSSYPFTAYELGGAALVEDFTNDGFPDVLFAGELNDQNCEEGYSSVLIRSQGWRMYPTIAFTQVVNFYSIATFHTSGIETYWRWGDVNSDGFDDVLAMDDQEFPNLGDSLRIFKNNGNGTFSRMYAGYLSDNSSCQVGVVDINNDGINELFALPNALYRWNGTGFTLLYNDNFGYCGPDGCNKMFFDFADFNHDGFMDVASTASGTLRFLKSNGVDRFTEYQRFTTGAFEKYLQWGDFDNDGDPDLLTSGVYTPGTSYLFENTSWGGFRPRDVDMKQHAHTGVGDLNGDGWPDIVSLQYRTEIGPAQLFYNQQGKLFFQDKTPTGFIQINNGVSHEGVQVWDIDGDGDNDIMYATTSDCSLSGVYLNNASLRNPNIRLRTPNGGENIGLNSTQTIRWIGNVIGASVRIDLSLDSGGTWVPIVASAPSTKYGGEYQWTVTGVFTSTKCLVRISDNENSALVDKSDHVFTISLTTAVNNPVILQQMKVYPNPAYNDFFNIETHGSMSGKKVVMQIYTINGNLVDIRSFIAPNGVKQVDIRRIPAGVYFVRMAVGKDVATYKLLKI